MSIYTQIKEAVSVPEAAERYGVPVNGSNRIPCPFHEDHDSSLGWTMITISALAVMPVGMW